MHTDTASKFIQSIQLLRLMGLLFWRWATPFWMFRDASRGTREQRIANFRHNRAQRDILPAYALKWMAIAAFMLLLLQVYSSMLAQAMAGSAAYFCAAVFCVSSGIGLSFACIVIAILMVCYLFFTQIKE